MFIKISKNSSTENNFYFFFRFLFILFSLIIFLSIPAYTRTYDPQLCWQTLESEHFLVHFPQKEDSVYNQSFACYVAEIAEETYQQITPQFGKPFYSREKIAIILEDFSDTVYGFASVIPHRHIRLNLSAPGFKNFDTKFENWLKIVIAHEYTHLAHFDMTDGLTTFLRFFLGQVIAPNALQPLWAIEGLAIYNESKWTSGGRLEDSRYEMVLRSDFLENRSKNLDQIQGSYLVSWPGGNAPYIYGQSLVHFIEQIFGEEKLINISQEFCAFPYLGMNRALKKVLGINQNELFDQWKESQNQKYRQQVEQISRSDEITDTKQITHHHYWVDNPLWVAKENSEPVGGTATVLYKVHTPKQYPSIREYDPKSKQEKTLVKRAAGHGTSYTLSPDKNFLLYTKLSEYQQYYLYYDLFLYHLKSGKQLPVSKGMRIKDPTWSPNPAQNQIAAVINQAGTQNLVIFSLDQLLLDVLDNTDPPVFSQEDLLSFSDLTYLSNFDDGTQISQPIWSPQSDQLAFSLWHEGFQDIFILNLDKGNQVISAKPITLDHYSDISPSWSADGQTLYFSSDRSGIFNLYAYRLKEEQLFRLTNMISGAFEPAVSPDGKTMAFIQYHATGYELHLADVDQLLWKPVDTGDGSLFYNFWHHEADTQSIQQNRLSCVSPIQTTSKYSIKEYSPWESLFPTYWIPYLSLTSHDLYLGFSSQAQDHLKFYTLPFTLARGILNDSLYYNFSFTDHTHKPIFSFSWEGETSFSSLLQATINFSSKGYTSSQDTGRHYAKNLSLGFQNEWSAAKEKQENSPEVPSGNIQSFILKYQYDDTEEYQASISPEIGHTYLLSYQYAYKKMGSEITFNKILFDGRKYFPLAGQNQVMALRLLAGIASAGLDEKEQFYLGGNRANPFLSTVNSQSFPLRGFAASSFSGNHLLASSLEYRFPIKTVEHKIGFDWASIFLERVSGTLFLDSGNAWEGKSFPIQSFDDIHISMGLELNFKFNRAHNNPFVVTVGTGKALTESSPFRFYAQTGISF